MIGLCATSLINVRIFFFVVLIFDFSMSEVERIMKADEQNKDQDFTFSLGRIFSAVTGKAREKSSEVTKEPAPFTIPKVVFGNFYCDFLINIYIYIYTNMEL